MDWTGNHENWFENWVFGSWNNDWMFDIKIIVLNKHARKIPQLW